MDRSNSSQLGIAAVLLCVAGFLSWRFFQSNDGISEKAFFYDLSEKKLFTADRSSMPPIRGVNDETHDAVRAVVISTTGKPEDKTSWSVAYLEMYSPELKQQLEEARASGNSPAMGRAAAQHQRLVKRPTDSTWHSLASPEGERIASEWAQPTTNGITPVVCSPD